MRKRPILFALSCFLYVTCYGQIEDIRKLQKLLPDISDSLRYVDALNRLGMLSYEKNIDSTFYYTRQARSIADRLRYAKGKADAANNLGIVYDMKGNLQLALRYYNDAYNRYKTLHDSADIVQTVMNIAMVYNEIGKNQKAITSFKNALTMGAKLKKDSILSFVLVNYILEYPEDINKDSLPVYISKARKIGLKYKDNRLLLAIDQLSADYDIKNNQRSKGIDLLQQTVKKAISMNLYYLSLDMLIDLGDLFVTTAPDIAVSYYKQGLIITEQKGYQVYTQIIDKKLYNFYTARGDISNAFYYSQQLLKLHDEQEKVNNSSGIDYIEYALKDQQLESAHIQSKYQSLFLFLAIMVCALTMVIIIILWLNWRKIQRTAAALRLQFNQSESTMEALDVINKNYARVIKIVAHDLRNPIGAINIITSIILPKEALNDEIKELVQLIQKSSNSCLELIRELLETNFDQQQDLNKEAIDIDELLEQCIHLLSFRAKDKDQELLLNTDLHVTIQADKEKILRALNNLIVNAMKFSPSGSEISVDAMRSESGIIISVKDTGMGIPISLQDKIFDPFTTAQRNGTLGEQPFGLGLYITKQIIEAHHGKIWFTTERGNGTTFYIELPLAETGDQISLSPDKN